jgi:L,D-peptidoglycan transpeptidase YkuD (ErfK/YbiS/YcfS/YnhG family)
MTTMIHHLQWRDGLLSAGAASYRATIGKAGVSADKREGDGKTPRGRFNLRGCYFRPDRVTRAPQTALPIQELSRHDGWCDDPNHPLYNQFVKLPFNASHEKLWRHDHAYDFIVPLGYNDDPVVAGKGSAIFLHLAQPDWRATEGCIAIARADMLELLARVGPETVLEVL